MNIVELIKQNKLLALVSILAFVVFVSFIYFAFFPQPITKIDQKPIVIYSPQPTQPPELDTPVSGKSYQVLSPNFDEQTQKDIKINTLINKLPFRGSNFLLEHNLKTDIFTLTLKKGVETEGDSEFNQFLKDNQIEDRSWLGTLEIKSE